jgi:hypothetical protein
VDAPLLKLYTDRALVEPGEQHVPMLNPFWGHGADPMSRPDFADRYSARASRLFALTDLEDADLAVYPVNWKRARLSPERIAQAQAFAERAKPRRTVVFYLSDFDDAVPLDGALVLRTSISRMRRRAGEFALPAFHEDLLERAGGELTIRKKTAKPIVSFCGFALFPDRPAGVAAAVRARAAAAKGAVLERLDRPSDLDVYVRSRAITALLRQRNYVRPELVLRSQGGGGGWSDHLSPAFREWDQVRTEYVDSIVNSDYVLCTRGSGNFSYRFYEALSLGRIPVLVDTDSALPYDFDIDWRDHCVWLRRAELPRIGERIAEFHERLTDDEFAERQRTSRRLWEEYLSPEGFFTNFHRHLEVPA